MNTNNAEYADVVASLNHRLIYEPPTTLNQLSGCVNPALERAAAIAELIEVYCEINPSGELPKLYRAAQAVSLEIMDAQAILKAYVDAAPDRSA